MTYPNYYMNGYTSPISMTQLQTPPDFTPCDIEWLDPTDLLLKQAAVFQDIFHLLPISPPLTASPGTDTQDDMSAEALVSLFPDILSSNQPVQPVQIQPRPSKPVPIMPKTAVPIAPRPGGAVFTPVQKRKVESVDSDEIAQKRQKNTDAARRSRLKKIIKMESLEKRVHELESVNATLNTRVAVLESEKGSLLVKDKGLEDRIRVLEAQLAEAHKALTFKAS
ncbi:hypothetical protein BDB01DRAFT_771825 [Pilobolus umbonatus]|nr:hypothetical protein BDB01DRAFT_771825 [Pilobolus umbonatus]